MSFYTSLSGLNAAQLDLNTTSNNIANAGTTGFKSSRAEFGDLISSSAFQSQSSQIGQGTRLKSISQEFNQGSTQTTSRALDLMVSGEGFFVTKSQGTGSQVSYTRDGAFSVNGQNNVVDSTGAVLQVLPVDTLGNVTASGPNALSGLHVSDTHGVPRATSAITQTITFPSDADRPASRSAYATGTAYAFSPRDANSYNYATSTTTYDTAGTAIPTTSYYVRDTTPAADGSGVQTSEWTVHTYVGDQEVFPANTTAAAKLTFDANGTLTAPAAPIAYGSVQPTGAAAAMTISVDYGTATKQGSYAFTQVASGQNGNTTGKLNNVSIGSDGLVSASYSDGSTVALGKVAMATFTNPQGLRQAGNTTWTQTGKSGEAKIGEANTDGRGAVNSGALEMSNVDLTQQLVQLISAQRNFQANAKAIDTDKQMLTSILQVQ